jgi:quercetin dioxygenase-like cupin family protein
MTTLKTIAAAARRTMRAQLKGLIPAVALGLALLLPLPAPASAFPAVADNSPAAQVAVSPAPTRDDLAGKLERRVVQRAPLSIPGREIVQVETKIPPGVESGWHVHPGEEVGYIIAGNVEMKVEGRPTVILRAGDGFLIPPNTPHNARDLGPDIGRMLSTYIVEPGQPLATVVHVDEK